MDEAVAAGALEVFAQLVGFLARERADEIASLCDATTLVELGPGAVLTGMAKRIVPTLTYTSVAAPADLERLATTLAEADEEPIDLDGDRRAANRTIASSRTS